MKYMGNFFFLSNEIFLLGLSHGKPVCKKRRSVGSLRWIPLRS